ncbi:unnamed protein product [Cuscuta epithymum]|uniref:Uncharacterized protein n=1 Tax=Cuscuta epithymum TaxID=186058 RepID=A0AAV0CT52_9ASTE|nr:unnamed protein product [Cuscuta epithymum]
MAYDLALINWTYQSRVWFNILCSRFNLNLKGPSHLDPTWHLGGYKSWLLSQSNDDKSCTRAHQRSNPSCKSCNLHKGRYEFRSLVNVPVFPLYQLSYPCFSVVL